MVNRFGVRAVWYRLIVSRPQAFDVSDDVGNLIPGSIHASRGMLEFHAAPSSPAHQPALDRAKRIVVYCATGGRSALAAKTLQDMGFSGVVSLVGGIAAWSVASTDN